MNPPSRLDPGGKRQRKPKEFSDLLERSCQSVDNEKNVRPIVSACTVKLNETLFRTKYYTTLNGSDGDVCALFAGVGAYVRTP